MEQPEGTRCCMGVVSGLLIGAVFWLLFLAAVIVWAKSAAAQEAGPCMPGQGECPDPCELRLPVWWMDVALRLDYRHQGPGGSMYTYTWDTTKALDPGLSEVSLGCCQGHPYRARWYVNGEVFKECWEPGVKIFADGFEEGLGPWQ